MTNALGRRQRFVEDREGAVDIARAGFGLGESDLSESVEDQNVLFAQKFDAAAHVVEPAVKRAGFSSRSALKEDPGRSPQRQAMLAR
jgi:hypothetical protein